MPGGFGEVISRGLQRFAPAVSTVSKSNAFAGRVTINSGSATATVSTTSVRSDSLIWLTAYSVTEQVSGFGQPIEVRSISPGNFFTIGYANSAAASLPARSTTVMWKFDNGS